MQLEQGGKATMASSPATTDCVKKPRRRACHQCNMCDYKTYHSGRLKTHIMVHTGERPYECHLCPRSFSQFVLLKNHLVTHTSERPFQCPLCLQKFRRKDILKRHHQRRHECH
ncbi:hypothetical protein MRX96_026721 [Rhipicephalus microplus]